MPFLVNFGIHICIYGITKNQGKEHVVFWFDLLRRYLTSLRNLKPFARFGMYVTAAAV